MSRKEMGSLCCVCLSQIDCYYFCKYMCLVYFLEKIWMNYFIVNNVMKF